MSSATTKSGTWKDSAERRMKRTVWDESHLTSEPLPLRSRLCRWSSAGRMARSTSSEDGSPTARDLARLPVNIGSVSCSGVRLCLCVCVCRVCDSCTWCVLCPVSCDAVASQTLESRFLRSFGQLAVVLLCNLGVGGGSLTISAT